MRNAEISGLTWDCVRWEEGGVLVCKSLRRDGYFSGHHSWATTKTGRERVVPLTPQVLEVLRQHKAEMKQLGIDEPYGLVFVAPTSYSNIYDHLVGRVWHRSLLRCGSKPRRLYAQRHSFLSHALAMGNSPADLAAAAQLDEITLPMQQQRHSSGPCADSGRDALVNSLGRWDGLVEHTFPYKVQ